MTARLPAFAKLNLVLEVLNKREDGYHNLRTIFQTINLADTVYVEAEPAAETHIDLVSDVEIPGENLMVRAAREVLRATRRAMHVRMRLEKRIPMGAGLGGGSSDAAAVLIALGRELGPDRLIEIGSGLGSDVPFFLLGGTAVGLGRGTELYPMADAPMFQGVMLHPGIHVSTAAAYGVLGRGRSAEERPNATARAAAAIALGLPLRAWGCVNDFEPVVSARHPEVGAAVQQLRSAGADVAMMTGSGSAVFGLFSGTPADMQTGIRFRLIGREEYRRACYDGFFDA